MYNPRMIESRFDLATAETFEILFEKRISKVYYFQFQIFSTIKINNSIQLELFSSQKRNVGVPAGNKYLFFAIFSPLSPTTSTSFFYSLTFHFLRTKRAASHCTCQYRRPPQVRPGVVFS